MPEWQSAASQLMSFYAVKRSMDIEFDRLHPAVCQIGPDIHRHPPAHDPVAVSAVGEQMHLDRYARLAQLDIPGERIFHLDPLSNNSM